MKTYPFLKLLARVGQTRLGPAQARQNAARGRCVAAITSAAEVRHG